MNSALNMQIVESANSVGADEVLDLLCQPHSI